MTFIKKRQWISIILCALMLTGVNGEDENESCRVNKHMRGICTVVHKCSIALQMLGQGKPHNMYHCGFTNDVDSDEIVCCPTTSIIRSIDVKSPIDLIPVNKTRITNNKQYCEEVSKSPLAVHHILGGENSSEGEFPHMASLLRETTEGYDWFCAAMIISSKYLLTAAHCLVNRIENKKVRVGVTQIDDPKAQDFDVENVKIRSDYSLDTKHNDIGLIKIIGTMKFGEKVSPACLHNENPFPQEQIITGWGVIKANTEVKSKMLQKALVNIVDITQCQQNYATATDGRRQIVPTQFCAASPSETKIVDACQADSGGPSQIKNQFGTYSIVGIISFGQACGGSIPGVYTKVSSYVDWIEKEVEVWESSWEQTPAKKKKNKSSKQKEN